MLFKSEHVLLCACTPLINLRTSSVTPKNKQALRTKKRSKYNQILLLPEENNRKNYRCHICTALGHQKVWSESDERPSCKQIPPLILAVKERGTSDLVRNRHDKYKVRQNKKEKFFPRLCVPTQGCRARPDEAARIGWAHVAQRGRK